MIQDHSTPAGVINRQQLSTNNTLSPSAYASPVPGSVQAFPGGKADISRGERKGTILSHKKEFQSPFSRITEKDWKDFREKILSPAQPSDAMNPKSNSRESKNNEKFIEDFSGKGSSQVKKPSQFCPTITAKEPPVISSFFSMPASPAQAAQQPILNFDTSTQRNSLNPSSALKKGKRFERKVSNFLDEDSQPPINVIEASPPKISEAPSSSQMKPVEHAKTILKNRSPSKKEAKVSHFKAVDFDEKVKDSALGVAGTHLKPPISSLKENRKKLNSLKTTALPSSKPLLTPPSKKNDRASVPHAPHKLNPEVDDFLFEIPSL